jgi:hypothetical protein
MWNYMNLWPSFDPNALHALETLPRSPRACVCLNFIQEPPKHRLHMSPPPSSLSLLRPCSDGHPRQAQVIGNVELALLVQERCPGALPSHHRQGSAEFLLRAAVQSISSALFWSSSVLIDMATSRSFVPDWTIAYRFALRNVK